MYRKITLFIPVILLGACAAGPDFKRPVAPQASGYLPQSVRSAAVDTLQLKSQSFVAAKQIPSDWWTIFQSAKLNALIDRALKANPDIDAAEAALRQAQQSVIVQQGFFYPTVGVSYSPSRNKLAGNMGG